MTSSDHHAAPASVVDNNNSQNEEMEGIDDCVANTTCVEPESQEQTTTAATPNMEEKPERREVKNVKLVDYQGKTGVYTGTVLVHNKSSADMDNDDGKVEEELIPDGQGTILYDNDHEIMAKYSGGWEHGAYSQQGVATMKTGDSYTGEYARGRRHGTGTYKWADGRIYSGNFENDQRHGQGHYKWPCGSVFNGAYVLGVRNGYGTYSDPTQKLSYAGDWKNGKYHGYGCLTTGEGDDKRVYRGNFDGPDGLPNGHGVEKDANGTIQHDGEWVDGHAVKNDDSQKQTSTKPKDVYVVVENEEVRDGNGNLGKYRGILNQTTRLPCGNGTLTYIATKNKNTEALDRYEGCFDDRGRYHGKGRLYFKSGDTYDGDFHKGIRHGTGTYKWADGRKYSGEFANNHRHGKGKWSTKSGDWYEGDFVEGHRCGNGRFVFDDGSTYDGEWVDGKYHGKGTLVGADGKTYSGGFKNGVAHGIGKEIGPDGKTLYEGQYINGITVTEARRKEAAAKKLKQHTKTPNRNLLDVLNSNASPTSVMDVDFDSGVDTSEPEACEAVVDWEIRDAEGNKGKYTGLVLVHNQKPHGTGRMVYLDGRRRHEGFWQNGVKHGHGRCLFQQGDFHEGEYVDNVRHGPGRYEWRDGRSFVGQYKNDLRDGLGVFMYPNGNRFEGVFKNGERSSGRFYFGDGLYEGEWKKGTFHGIGSLEYRDGRTYEGRFFEGKFAGPIKPEDTPTGDNEFATSAPLVDENSEPDNDQPKTVDQLDKDTPMESLVAENGVAAAQTIQ